MSEAREKSHYSVIFYFYTVNGVLFKSASSEPKSAEEKSGWTPDSNQQVENPIHAQHGSWPFPTVKRIISASWAGEFSLLYP